MAESAPAPAAISALYSELVLRHNRSPYGFAVLESATHQGEAENRSCGDQVQIALHIDASNRISAAHFQGESCAICTAAASILCQSLEHRDVAAALTFLTEAESVIQTGVSSAQDLGELAAFTELRQAPARRRCALLPLSATRMALRSFELDST